MIRPLSHRQNTSAGSRTTGSSRGHRTLRPLLCLLTVLSLVALCACGGTVTATGAGGGGGTPSGSGTGAQGGSGTGTQGGSNTGTQGGSGTGTQGGSGTGDTQPPGPGNEAAEQQDIDAAVKMTDGFWTRHWSDFFTGSYTSPVVDGGYDGTSGPLCHGQASVPDNAFYCDDGDFVAWDNHLMQTGYAHGDSFPYLVIAHEWGHAIQARLNASLQSQSAELQADCLAGATIYGSAKDGTIVFEEGDEKEIVDALSDLSDETPWTQTEDHGDAFQRVDAFNLGRSGGVAACLPDETN